MKLSVDTLLSILLIVNLINNLFSLHMPSPIYICPVLFTYAQSYLHMPSPIYICPVLFTYAQSYLHMSSPIYICPVLITYASPICVKQFYILCALELQAHLFYIMVLKTFCNSYKLKGLKT